MMAKKSSQHEPSDCVHDTYRKRNAGLVDVCSNSKSATSDYYVDREQLGTHLVFEFKNGKYSDTQVKNDIQRNVRAGMGGLKHRSSNKQGDCVHGNEVPQKR